MDRELLKILMGECRARAAANTGEERRFFQALVWKFEQLKAEVEALTKEAAPRWVK